MAFVGTLPVSMRDVGLPHQPSMFRAGRLPGCKAAKARGVTPGDEISVGRLQMAVQKQHDSPAFARRQIVVLQIVSQRWMMHSIRDC
jgi:hypothetical protein